MFGASCQMPWKNCEKISLQFFYDTKYQTHKIIHYQIQKYHLYFSLIYTFLTGKDRNNAINVMILLADFIR